MLRFRQCIPPGVVLLLATAASGGAERVGVYGGSYDGFYTALGLARNSDLFKAGVNLHGVHDWSQLLDEIAGKPATRFEQGDRAKALEIAGAVDLARRLEARNLPFEELVIPNEIHGFLRHASWLRADQASVDFLIR